MGKFESLWENLKDKEINLFGLNVKVKEKFTFIGVTNDSLLLKDSIGAAVPALENLLGNKYKINKSETYVIVEEVK